MSNAVHLSFHWRTKEEVQAEVRANAVFIHSKLVAGGMDVAEARSAVERLFSAGWREGYEDGHEDSQDSVSDNS
jgi:hypothetical protein